MINDDDVKLIIAKEEYLKGKSKLQKLEGKKTTNYRKWLLVASVLLLVCINGFWFLNQQPTSKELYAEYFEPYTNVIAPVSRNDDKLSFKEIAFLNYQEKKYDNALANFNELLRNTSTEEQKVINLYKAICLLALEKPEQAIAILQNYTSVNNRFKDKYLWYLSLAYLQNNGVDNTKKTLKILAKEKYNFKKKETLLLLESLE